MDNCYLKTKTKAKHANYGAFFNSLEQDIAHTLVSACSTLRF